MTDLDLFEEKVSQCVRIRAKITEDRVQAINILSLNLQDPNGLFLLKRCVKNEEWFLRIVERGMVGSMRNLEEINNWNNSNKKDSDAKIRINQIVRLLKNFDSQISNIRYRLGLETDFINNPFKELFDRFLYQYTKENGISKQLVTSGDTKSIASVLLAKLNSERKLIKEVMIALSTTITAFVNDTQLLPNAGGSEQLLRDFDHLLAGIGAPYILGLAYKPLSKLGLPVPNKFLTYAAWAIYWETKQYNQRGFFQFDQLVCDLVGLSIAFAIDKIFLKE